MEPQILSWCWRPLPLEGRVGEGVVQPHPDSYRVNDWGLPASTLMMLPVDLDEASDAKK